MSLPVLDTHCLVIEKPNGARVLLQSSVLGIRLTCAIIPDETASEKINVIITLLVADCMFLTMNLSLMVINLWYKSNEQT
jgi:hypothetical protein